MTVFTNGCFDVLHVGHVLLLRAARQHGDRLVVGLNSDRAVAVLKGRGRPLQPQEHRKLVLAELRCVDAVVLVNSLDMCAALREIRPDVWVKGGDYTLESLNPREVEVARRLGIRIVLAPIQVPVHTTDLLQGKTCCTSSLS